MSYHGMGQIGPRTFTGRDIAVKTGASAGGGGGGGALLVDTSAFDALVPRDCQPPVAYAPPPDTLPEGSVVAYVWPMVTWPSGGSVNVSVPPPQLSTSGGGYSYTGTPSPSSMGGQSVDVGKTRDWVARLQASGSVALAGFIPRPQNDSGKGKGVAWVISFVSGGPAPSALVANALRAAGLAAVASGPLGTGGRLPINLGVGLPAVVPLVATALPTVPDWRTFSDGWPRANAQVLQAVLMVEGSFASLSAALSASMATPNANGPALAMQNTANSLATSVAQGRMTLQSVTTARVAAAQAAQQIPGIVQAAQQTIAGSQDAAAIDAAARAAQAQINAILANVAAWQATLASAASTAASLGSAANAAATQFTPVSVLSMAMTPSVQAAISSQGFEIAKNAVKCRVLEMIRGSVTPAYVALMNTVAAARDVAGQLTASAQSTALSGWSSRRRTGFLGALVDLFSGGGSSVSDRLTGGGSGGTPPAIASLQSTATQALATLQDAASRAKAALPAVTTGGGTTTGGGGTVTACPPGTIEQGRGNCIPIPAADEYGPPGPGLTPPLPGGDIQRTGLAASTFPWVPVVAGVAVVGVGAYYMLRKPAVKANKRRSRRRSSRRRARAYA